MQDRYAGDIGDFGKFGLLREIEKQKLNIGVNWYLTKPINKKEEKQNDGKHEIKDEYEVCDKDLFKKLKSVFKGKRSVKNIENQKLLTRTVYYSEAIKVDEREKWHEAAVRKLKKCDIVFLDPDNGLEVKSTKNSKKKLSKYVLVKEIESYINQKQSVVLYNHRPRRDKDDYFKDLFNRLKSVTKISPLSISFHKGTVRDYILIPVKKEHKDKFESAIKKMTCTDSEWFKKKLCTIDY